ncbi:MAG: SDR family oxidoreductase [bacterium]
MFRLDNNVAIVTGAGGLIGKQHCIALTDAGANVIACDLNVDKINAYLPDLCTQSYSFVLDVTNEKSIEELLKFTLEKFGRVDVLINNAAINDMFENPKTILELSKYENYPLKNWQKSVDVNLTGAFLTSKIIGGYMATQKNGNIINIASTYGVVAPNQELYKDNNGEQQFYKPPVYSVTKAGIIALTKYSAAYWGKSGIRVNCLSPGGVENNQPEYFIQKYSEKTPLGRMAKTYDYRGAIVFLASKASCYMTGENLIIDGGFTIW